MSVEKPMLEVRGICRKMGGRSVLDGVSLTLEQGRILCVLGPSGCGKTTLLRVIAGLETADSGTVLFNGRDMAAIPPHRRNFGMMFQEFALFPHKSVAQNIAFGPEIQKQEPAGVARRVAQLVDLVGLAGLEDRGVADLSGGERQRVALARSLAPRPNLLLLDEPMGALDRVLRDRLMMDLRRILKALDTTAVVVTHDHAEAFAVADRVAVLFNGRVAQVDPPEELYRRPASAVVAAFLGFRNIVPGVQEPGELVRTGLGCFEVQNGLAGNGAPVDLLIRPDAVCMEDDPDRDPDAPGRLQGRVLHSRFVGAVYRVAVRAANDQSLEFDLPIDSRPPETGAAIALRIKPAGLVAMPRCS